jgi:hypothetical protein
MTQNAAHLETYPTPRIEVRPLLRNVYLWMTLALLVTAASAYLTVETGAIKAFSNWIFVWGIFIVQLILVAVLAAAIFRMSTGAAVIVFLVYAAVTGFSLSLLVIYYDVGTLTTAFFSTAGLFAAMSIVGAFTSADLTKLGTYLFVGLIGLIFAMLLNIFLRSSAFDLIISLVGVVIFSLLTAYDTQKIVKMSSDPRIQGQGSELRNKLSILGALTLYLDFLNLFLFLVRILGRSQ